MSSRSRCISGLLLAASAGWIALGAFGLRHYLSADHLGVLSDPAIIEQARAACDRLAQDVNAIDRSGTGRPQIVARVRAQDEAIRRLRRRPGGWTAAHVGHPHGG